MNKETQNNLDAEFQNIISELLEVLTEEAGNFPNFTPKQRQSFLDETKMFRGSANSPKSRRIFSKVYEYFSKLNAEVTQTNNS